LTRAEYLAGRRAVTQAAARAETEGALAVRRAVREALAPLTEEIRSGRIPGLMSPVFDKQALAERLTAAIQEYAEKPVTAMRELQDKFEKELRERLGIEAPRRGKTPQNKKRRNVSETVKIIGKALGVGAAVRGVSAYHRDPETGTVVWDDAPLEYIFTRRYGLSARVWKSVEDMEESVQSLMQGCIALGRTKQGTVADLETYINFPDGGARVMGRWGKMFPNTPKGRREAWKRQYLAEHGGMQYGTEAAKALLEQPEAEAWIQARTEEKTKRGTPRLPQAVKDYSNRLGKTGLDYRVIREERTEIAALLSDEQKAIARNSFIASGKMEWVLERGRDHWNCRCGELAAGGPYDADDPRDKNGSPIDIPLHPNCGCQWRPVLLSDEEVMKKYRDYIKG
jgi:hypothetical protein